jgi:dUTP pyrophosphatase
MTPPLTIELKRIAPEHNGDIPLPRYMTPNAAGMDIRAALQETLILKPKGILLIPTGFAIALPRGYEAQIRPRSGLAVKHGITVVNAPGTIDSDYRGEVKVGLINLGRESYSIRRGDRIAQMIIQRVYRVDICEVTDLDRTERDSGGFGSTGKG